MTTPPTFRPATPAQRRPGGSEHDAGQASAGTSAGQETAPEQRWRPPRLWLFALWLSNGLVRLLCRLRVTTSMDYRLTAGPLILAGNHISLIDPIVLMAAARQLRIAPRIMATGGLFRTPILGPLMRRVGHIPVDRGRDTVTQALPDAIGALRGGAIVMIYPEGRIGLDPQMWPEKAKTGMARLALATGAPVVPVAIWGSHEMIAYHGGLSMTARVLGSAFRRPRVNVHFGQQVDLSDLVLGAVGHAQRGSERIMAAIDAALVPLRPDEPRLPRWQDPTRPVSIARVRDRG
jgi:1-acyl-sn-glycerol-3-phosphate acyltransferase